jgi:hypothetical protein
MGAIGNDAIATAAKASPLQAKYGQTIDPQSAYEILQNKVAPPPAGGGDAPAPPVGEPPAPASASGEAKSRGAVEGSVVSEVLQSSAFKSFLRSAATVAGREITRSIFGTGRRR